MAKTKHVIPITGVLVFDDDDAYHEFVKASSEDRRRSNIGKLLASGAARLLTPCIDLELEDFYALAAPEASWMTEASVAEFVGDDSTQLKLSTRCTNALFREMSQLDNQKRHTIRQYNPLARVRKRYEMEDNRMRLEGLYIPDLQDICVGECRAEVIRRVTGFGETSMQFLESYIDWARRRIARAHDEEAAELLGIPVEEAAGFIDTVVAHSIGMTPEEVNQMRR